MLAPEPGHLDHKGRYSNQYQRSGENNHSGSEHGGTVYHGASNDEDQPYAATCYPQHGYAAQPGIDIRRPKLARQLDQTPLLGNFGLQFPQLALLLIRHGMTGSSDTCGKELPLQVDYPWTGTQLTRSAWGRKVQEARLGSDPGMAR